MRSYQDQTEGSPVVAVDVEYESDGRRRDTKRKSLIRVAQLKAVQAHFQRHICPSGIYICLIQEL